MRRPIRSFRRSVVGTVFLVGLLLAAGWFPANASAAPVAHFAATPAAASAPAGGAAFAARAGFAAWHAADSSSTVPATGSLSVDVVFDPQDHGSLPGVGHGSLPVARFAEARGLSEDAYAAAESYFARAGLTVTHTWPDRLALSLTGPPGALDAAFGTRLEAGMYADRPVVFPATPPSLPASLESEVAGVVGLSSGFDQFSIDLSATRAVVPLGGPAGDASNSTNTITPGMARQMYNLSELYNLSGGPSDASSESIALVLWGAGYDPSDISTFFAQDYPFATAPALSYYPVDGAPAPSSSAPSSSDPLAVEELTLDIEWAGSAAPGAHLDAVYGPTSSDLTDALETALSISGITVISMSFGAPESSDGSLGSSWGSLFTEAQERGITVLAATGDTGGDTNSSCAGGPAPEYPASATNVLAVGGTAVTVNRTVLGAITGYSESAWVDSGGGFSRLTPAPGWQTVGSAASAIRTGGGGRGTPDVSATASDNFLYYDGANQAADGTSFATPLWAGLVAELDAHIGHPLGWFTDRLYHIAANLTRGGVDDGLRDITSGHNCIAAAVGGPNGTLGWDAATGWGSPRAAIFYEDLAGSFVNLTLDAAPSTVAPGASVAVRVEVVNWSSGQPISNAPVVLRVASGTSVGPCTGTFDAIQVETNGTGWASAQLGVPACFLGAHATVTASVTTVRLYGTSSTHIAVNLLGLLPALEGLGDPPYSYLLYVGIVGAAVAAGGWLGRRRPGLPAPRVPPGAIAPSVAPPPAAGRPSPAVPGPPPSPAPTLPTGPAGGVTGPPAKNPETP